MIKKIVPYKPEHLDVMDLNGETRVAVGVFGFDSFKKMIGGSGPAFTGLVDGKPTCVAGVTMIWKGVGEAWALMANGYEKHAFFIHRNVIRFMDRIIIEYNLNRVQAVAQSENQKACHWLVHLGFKREGLMKKYFFGRDFWRFARVM